MQPLLGSRPLRQRGMHGGRQRFQPHHHGVTHHPLAIAAALHQRLQAALSHGTALRERQIIEAQLAQSPRSSAAHAGADVLAEGILEHLQAPHVTNASQGTHGPGTGAVVVAVDVGEDRVNRGHANSDQAIHGRHGGAWIVEPEHLHQAGGAVRVR